MEPDRFTNTPQDAAEYEARRARKEGVDHYGRFIDHGRSHRVSLGFLPHASADRDRYEEVEDDDPRLKEDDNDT